MLEKLCEISAKFARNGAKFAEMINNVKRKLTMRKEKGPLQNGESLKIRRNYITPAGKFIVTPGPIGIPARLQITMKMIQMI